MNEREKWLIRISAKNDQGWASWVEYWKYEITQERRASFIERTNIIDRDPTKLDEQPDWFKEMVVRLSNLALGRLVVKTQSPQTVDETDG